MTINCFENRQKFKTLSGDIGRAKVTRIDVKSATGYQKITNITQDKRK